MKITFVCKQVTADEKLKALIEKKIGKLEKFFRDDAEAFVTLSRYKKTEVLELTISMGGTLFRSEVEGESFYHDIDVAVDVIERQLRKNKTRLEKRIRKEAFADTFFVFLNQDTDSVCVVYRRNDGGYGLIETQR